jgi:hypothetical protein
MDDKKDKSDAYGEYVRNRMNRIAGGEKPEHHDPIVRSDLFSSGDIVIRPGKEKGQ